jgi:hypothetical protein
VGWYSAVPKQKTNSLLWTNAFLLLFSLWLLKPVSLNAQSTLDALSDQVATGIQREKDSSFFPKVLVVDFLNPASGIDALGAYLADQLSASLENKLPAGAIIPRKKLLEFLEAYRLSPLDLQSVSIAYWAADNLGANEILYGVRSLSDGAIALDLKLLRIATAKEAAIWNVALPATAEILARKGKALDLPEAPDALKLAMRCGSGDPLAISQAFLNSGGTLPRKIRWPMPPYSEEARKKKLSAARMFDTVIDENGQSVLVIPHRPLLPELDDTAVQTLRTWKSHPAQKDGRPVPVCVVLEMTWRLY